MSSRLPVLAGLATGVLTAAVAIVLLVTVAPGPASTVRPTASAGAGVSVPPSPGRSPSDSTLPASTGSAVPSPDATGSAGTANFGIGEPAPPLRVPQVGGGTIDLAALQGKPVWVNFMATWCPPCVDELPLMNGFAARYADDGLVVVAVDVREDPALVAGFVSGLDTRFPVGLDEDGAAQREWGAFALPVHFWVDADGVVRDGALGGIGPDVMATGVEAILPGVDVTP